MRSSQVAGLCSQPYTEVLTLTLVFQRTVVLILLFLLKSQITALECDLYLGPYVWTARKLLSIPSSWSQRLIVVHLSACSGSLNENVHHRVSSWWYYSGRFRRCVAIWGGDASPERALKFKNLVAFPVHSLFFSMCGSRYKLSTLATVPATTTRQLLLLRIPALWNHRPNTLFPGSFIYGVVPQHRRVTQTQASVQFCIFENFIERNHHIQQTLSV